MTAPSTRPDDVARALVMHETGGSNDPDVVADAVEGICRYVASELEGMLGSGGVRSLMTRALHLARREHPSLESVTMSPGPVIGFTGLTEAMASRNPTAVAAGTSVLAQLLGLLVALLGEDLGLQPVRKFWPHVAPSVREVEE